MFMLTQYEKHLKGRHAYNIERSRQIREKYYLNPKICPTCQLPLSFELRRNKFCNHSCSAKLTNMKRIESGYCLVNKTKQIKCNECTASFILPLQSRSKLCNKCKQLTTTNTLKTTIFNNRICKCCQQMFIHRSLNRKTCSEKCAGILKRQGAINGGKKSAAIQSQNRRSKNEIHFAELCKDGFANVLTNEPMFNGWDADIILPDYKIAIMWNGAWHYKKITKRHSVEQVQNRDKIKIREIEQAGYISYIIKDPGIENREFVIEQFNKFKEWQALVTIQA